MLVRRSDDGLVVTIALDLAPTPNQIDALESLHAILEERLDGVDDNLPCSAFTCDFFVNAMCVIQTTCIRHLQAATGMTLLMLM